MLVASLTPEPHSDDADRWLRAHRAEQLIVTPWVSVELASALTMKVRNRTLSEAYREEALAGWARLLRTALQIEPIESRHFTDAIGLAGRRELGLRGGDALHLAVAVEKRCAMATLDQRLADAARLVGVAVPQIGGA